MKTFIALSTLVLVCFSTNAHTQSIEQRLSPAYNNEQHPCIAPAQYRSIEHEIAVNRQLLHLHTTNRGPLTLTPLQWPLQPSSSLHDCSYYYIAAYVDHDATTAVKDFNCGTYTYNGHTGTDIAIGPFPFYKMDSSQVEVVAAAAGTIVSKHDGEYDRNCVGAGSGLTANSIIVQHADGSVALYWHMKNGLTTKTTGQTVAAGEHLGFVGSSGSSSGCHLHFEVWAGSTASTLIDPFAGTCNLKNASSWWIAQKPYTEPAVVKASVHTTDIVMPACPVTETPNESTSYSIPFQGSGLPPNYAKFYAFVRNGTAGQPVDMTILNPDATVNTNWTYTLTSSFNFGTLGFSKKLPLTAGTYTFNATYQGKTCTQAFDIITVLPISLAWFRGESMRDHNQLQWQTLSENNSDYFGIEKSFTGEIFTAVGRVKAAGNSTLATNYSYQDKNEIEGIAYYRLKQVNTDGSYSYSNVLKLTRSHLCGISLYPNPARDHITIPLPFVSSRVEITIADITGKVVLRKMVKVEGNTTSLSTNTLSPGVYTVTVMLNDELYRERLMIK